MSYSLPSDADERPIAIDGAGTLGRRIASVYAAGGSAVRIFDLSEEQRHASCDYVGAQIERVRETLNMPEKVELKQVVFGQLDELAEPDAILASNSSSIPTSQMISKVSLPQRVLNTHYQQPPELNSVELMSCGETDDGVIEALMAKLPRYGLVPFRVRRESDGFIFNRVWAAIKRECLMVVEEGVAAPEDVDGMWKIFTAPGIPPFRLMDRVGLDVVLNIEEHYAAVRSGLPEAPRKLLHKLIEEGRVGVKSGRGFYDYPDTGKSPKAGGPS